MMLSVAFSSGSTPSTVSCPDVVPASAGSVHASVGPTILTCGSPLVWKFVPVNVTEVAAPDTSASGVTDVIVFAGSVIAITTGVPLPSRASAKSAPASSDQQTLFPAEPVPVAVVSNVTSNVADVSDAVVS